MTSQRTKREKCDFLFSHKINDLQSLILAAPPCTAMHYSSQIPELTGSCKPGAFYSYLRRFVDQATHLYHYLIVAHIFC